MITKTAILLLIAIIRGETLNVPSDYSTIQNAINFSSENDTILIAPGIYYENLTIDDKNINFLSSNSSEATIIDGSSEYNPVFIFNNISEPFELNGLTIQNGTGLIINGASYGGGILSNNSNISMNNIIIENNFAFAGGGICFYATQNSNTSPTINNTQIKNNLASEGGGIFCVNHTLAIFNTDITRNGMDLFGSGGGIQALLSEISIQNSKINLNETKFGGGIYISNSNSDISNTLIENNYSDSKGGGIWVGGNTNLEIVKSIISDNYSSGFGGGIFNSLSNTTITNSNIVKNTVSSNVSGAGIYIDGGNSIINNSIIYFNYNDNTFNNPNYNIDGYSSNNFYEYNITYSNIQGSDDWIPDGLGIISQDPLFTDLENNIYTLTSQSPCIDAGDPLIIDNDNTVSDIGAYPYNQNQNIGDINNDGIVNISDIVILVNIIISQEYSLMGDLNYDNTNNIQDIVILINIILSS